MASRLNPYIQFDGTAREAMELYRSVLGGDLNISTFGDFGEQSPELKDKVMHAMLTTPAGLVLMASDTAPGMPYSEGSRISVSLSGDDDALRGYFDGLAAEGTVAMPLEKQAWGDEFGQLVDKYGVSWLVNIGTAGN